ncbi:MAG: hypothetical protein RL431_337 [Actinomycetota bacterium]|jgi:methionyl-tRNA formyltransferase
MTFSAVFAGSPQVAVPYLEALIGSGVNVVAVLTREDAPVGRKRVITPTPVALCAERHGISVIKANTLKDVTLPPAEIGLVVAYGALIPQSVLEMPTHGWLNVHFSTLPEWRGAAPVQRAIMAGADTIGVSIFRLVEELDAGPVAWASEYPLDAEATASEALEQISLATAPELVRVARTVVSDTATFTDQVGDGTYAHKLTRSDGLIDWALPAGDVVSLVRGATDEPGAFTHWGDATFGVNRCRKGPDQDGPPGTVVFVDGRVLVHCGSGTVELTRVKPAGKSVMSASDWARGVRESVRFA